MERIDHFFDGVAWKILSAVDADPNSSNQHELGGLVKAGFKEKLGDPGSGTIRYPARFLLLAEDDSESLSAEGQVSWYDSRRDNEERSPELRLYYATNAVTEAISAGMLLVIAKTTQGEILLVFADVGSSAEQQLRWLFGLNGEGQQFSSKALDRPLERSSWAATWILEQLGIDTVSPDSALLDRILARFGSNFPPTKDFSAFASDVAVDIDITADPDNALIVLMDTEERLFRLLERHIVEHKVREGFPDVDSFISYSLSVHNRRKSRAGYAFENHLEQVFVQHAIQFARGVQTENRSRPDFLFPGGEHYHNPDFPNQGLTMLGVKSSCKDRWRQVLSEAARIQIKHLATLEPGISSFQTAEMESHSLQLVIPEALHETYSRNQREWLWTISDFVGEVKERQSRYL